MMLRSKTIESQCGAGMQGLETHLTALTGSGTFVTREAAGRTGWRLFCFVFFLLLFIPEGLSAAPSFPLHTSGAYIVDANENRVRLNAFNWYGGESKDYVVAGLESQPLQSIVQTIKGMGFNAVRLQWSNELYEKNPVVPGYALSSNPSLQGENALTIMDGVVSALTSAQIMVILDNHNSDAEWCCGDDGNDLWYNSNYPESSWLSDWEGMVQRYQNNPWVIGADLRNEPRVTATWGGNPTTDWRAAAMRGGNAVLGVNPNLLIFVEGINYALDLSGVSSNPVQLNVAKRLVYSAHDYGFDYSNLTSYTAYVSDITTRWGYLVSGSNPQPLWVGEFGTCNSSATCVSSSKSSDNGYWFGFLTTYIQQYGLDWSYWAINGTQSTGSGRTYGTAEAYGVLNTSWNGSALSDLTSRLGTMITAPSGFQLFADNNIQVSAAGQSGSTTVSIIPLNGFSGAVSLSCAVTSTVSGVPPTCTVPSSTTISGTSAVKVTVNVATTGSGNARNEVPRMPWHGRAGIAVAGLLLFCVPKGRAIVLGSLVLVIFAMLSLSACGGSGGSSSGGGSANVTASGTYTLTLTGSSSGAATQTAQIGLVVN